MISYFLPLYLFCSNKAGIKIPERAGTKARKREEDQLPLVRSTGY